MRMALRTLPASASATRHTSTTSTWATGENMCVRVCVCVFFFLNNAGILAIETEGAVFLR